MARSPAPRVGLPWRALPFFFTLLSLAHGAWFKSLVRSGRCSVRAFREKLTALDSVCCAPGAPGGSSPCDPGVAGGAPTQCSPRCAAMWTDLRSQCGARVDVSFDTMDGTDDGAASVVSSLQSLCDEVSVPEIVAELAELQDAGCDVNTEGVAEVEVTTDTSGCVDTGAAGLCSMVANGLLSCQNDFCPECGGHAGECDRTCAFCGGHRRNQIHLSDVCSAATLQERVGPVNSACCDEDRAGMCDGGAGGVPTFCDARCAGEFVPFYQECEVALRSAFAADPETGRLLFARNGEWRVAFDGVRPAAGGLHPALTAKNMRLRANFGDRGWAHGPPDASYTAAGPWCAIPLLAQLTE